MPEQMMRSEEHARAVFTRWEQYVKQAREEQGASAPLDRLVARASSLWIQHEPSELAFVPEAIRDLMHEHRHDTTETALLERVERGELVALRRRADGDVVYRTPAAVAAMTSGERARYEDYDPLLARALREYALESDLGRLFSEAEG